MDTPGYTRHRAISLQQRGFIITLISINFLERCGASMDRDAGNTSGSDNRIRTLATSLHFFAVCQKLPRCFNLRVKPGMRMVSLSMEPCSSALSLPRNHCMSPITALCNERYLAWRFILAAWPVRFNQLYYRCLHSVRGDERSGFADNHTWWIELFRTSTWNELVDCFSC